MGHHPGGSNVPRILSGVQPTGNTHIRNYVGAS
jgi:tryptophanyl-tRNA synthetase